MINRKEKITVKILNDEEGALSPLQAGRFTIGGQDNLSQVAFTRKSQERAATGGEDEDSDADLAGGEEEAVETVELVNFGDRDSRVRKETNRQLDLADVPFDKWVGVSVLMTETKILDVPAFSSNG